MPTFSLLAYMADRCISQLRCSAIDPSDMTIEITFTQAALRRVGSERPEILGITRLNGIDVTFPEREYNGDGWDWGMEVTAASGAVDVQLVAGGTIEALLDT